MRYLKPALTELVCTFIFCFIGAASVMNFYTEESGALIGIALAHGLALSIAVSATISISGGQINPAVTIGLILIGKEKPERGAWLITGQMLGACISGLILMLTFTEIAQVETGLGTPALAPGVTTAMGISLELIATFLLAFAFYGIAIQKDAPSNLAGFGIGLTVAFLILATGPLTGTAINPARHFGTALFGNRLAGSIPYWIGPIVGSILGFRVARYCLQSDT